MVDTSIEGNPTEGLIDGLRMQYVLRRKTTKQHRGDGNPLIYALKEMKGYRMQPMYRRMLDAKVGEILFAVVEGLDVDALIDMPSSKPLCAEFAAQVSEVSGLPLLRSTFLRKRTVGEVLDGIDAEFPVFTKHRDERSFKQEVGKLRRAPRESDFQMKEVQIAMRRFFQPFAMAGDLPTLAGQRIALIDDLLSSGTSIASVAACLRDQGAIVAQGVCLLSDLKARRSVRHD